VGLIDVLVLLLLSLLHEHSAVMMECTGCTEWQGRGASEHESEGTSGAGEYPASCRH
jgi:hypothetical protein